MRGSRAARSQSERTFFSFLLPSTRNVVGVALFQHLTPRLRELEGQEAARCQGPGGEEDGHRLGDADEGGEDADPEDGGEFAERVEEAESRGPEERQAAERAERSIIPGQASCRRTTPVYLLSEGYSSTVNTSREFQEAMPMPPNKQSRAIMADSLLPKDRKKQLTQEMTLEPAGGAGRTGKWENGGRRDRLGKTVSGQ